MNCKVAVLDDEESCLDIIETIIMHHNSMGGEIKYIPHRYSNAFLFLEDLERGIRFDLYLLDIEVPYRSGIQIAETIRETSDATIIFVTAYKKYALEGYRLGVFRYIHKTRLHTELPLALMDASRMFLLQKEKFVLINIPKFSGKLYYSDIIYIYKESKNSVFVLKKENSIMKVRKTLEEVYREISSDDFFFADRCNIVNLRYIEGLKSDIGRLLLYNSIEINVSKSRCQQIKDTITLYWGKNI